MMSALFWLSTAIVTDESCQALKAPSQQLAQLEQRLEQVHLDNGFKAFLLAQPERQTVAIATEFAVGSAHEQKGQTGYAHLFEHMLFKGSEHAPGSSYQQQMKLLGGQFNAETYFDYTRYYTQFPAVATKRVLWMEADRFARPIMNEDTVNNQKAAVLEETAMRLDNVPYYRVALEAMLSHFADTPYGHSILGSAEDIHAATPNSLHDFFLQHYRPDRARLALVGNFSAASVRPWIESEFAQWQSPDNTPPKTFHLDIMPKPFHQRVVDARAPWPALLLAWHTVGADHPDFVAVQLLQRYLLERNGNIISQHLRQNDSTFLTQSIPLAMEQHGLANLVLVPRAHVSLDELAKSIESSIADVANTSISSTNLCQLKTEWLLASLQELDDPLALAQRLATGSRYNEHFPLSFQWSAIEKLTPDDLNRVAKQYFLATPMRLDMEPSWYMRWTKSILQWLPESWTQGIEESVL